MAEPTVLTVPTAPARPRKVSGTPVVRPIVSNSASPRRVNLSRKTVRRAKFLAAVAKGKTVAAAARAARVHRSSHYGWLADPTYAAAFAAAREAGWDAVEAKGRRPGPAGDLAGLTDGQLLARLRRARPHKFRRDDLPPAADRTPPIGGDPTGAACPGETDHAP